MCNIGPAGNSYFRCGTSTAEFAVKVAAESLTGTLFVLTWLLSVYPSRVYMSEFYMNRWSGQRSAEISIFLERRDSREATPVRTIRSIRDDKAHTTELKSDHP